MNPKFREKINEIPAPELRCQPLGRDVNGRAYWFLAVSKLQTEEHAQCAKQGLQSILCTL